MPVWVGDAELGGPLVLPVRVDDELDAVARIAWRKVGGGNPEVVAGVGNLFDNRVEYFKVVRWTLEKEKRHSAFCRRLPGDAVFLAHWDDIVEARGVDRIPLWRITHWLCVRAGQRHEARKTCREEAEEREIGHVAG